MKKLLLPIIFSTFIFALFVSAQKNYDRAQLWDAEINALTEIDLKQTTPKNAVLFVGSSTIRLWKSLRDDFPDFTFINRGFGGSRLEDVNFYFDRIVAPYHPKTIVLYAGENDVNEGVAPEKVLTDYRKFSELIRAKFPKAKLLYISLKPSPSRWNLAESFRKTNDLIKTEIAADKRARFVDVWAAMLNEKGEPKPEIFLEDKLHLNEKGYEIWREVLAKSLK